MLQSIQQVPVAGLPVVAREARPCFAFPCIIERKEKKLYQEHENQDGYSYVDLLSRGFPRACRSSRAP